MNSKKKIPEKKVAFSINKLKKNELYFVHELTPDNIGKAIREVRKKRNLTLQEFADYLGIALSTLSQVENNTKSTRISTIFKIFERLHTKVYFQVELQRFWKEFNATKKRELKKNKKKS